MLGCRLNVLEIALAIIIHSIFVVRRCLKLVFLVAKLLFVLEMPARPFSISPGQKVLVHSSDVWNRIKSVTPPGIATKQP